MTNDTTTQRTKLRDHLPTDFIKNAYEHFVAALVAHPRFTERLFWRIPTDSVDLRAAARWADKMLVTRRNYLLDPCRVISAEALLQYKMAKAFHGLAHLNDEYAIEELYDAVAVLMRMIAVVEGKQRLGGEA